MRILLLLALVASLGGEHRAYAQTANPYEMVTCSLETRGTNTQGQPIVFRLILDNRSLQPVTVNLGYDREGAFRFKIKRPDGSLIAPPQKQVREGISRVGEFRIPAGERYSQQIIVDEWYKFIAPGSYVVSLTMPESICSEMALPVDITPPDAEELSKFSLELANAVRENKKNYEKASEAATVLARIENPLVVPFLMKAVEANTMVDSILIPALERIGDNAAIRSLIT